MELSQINLITLSSKVSSYELILISETLHSIVLHRVNWVANRVHDKGAISMQYRNSTHVVDDD